MKRQIAIEIICFLFIILFLYAAFIKLVDYQKFAVQIRQSPLLVPIAGLVAVVIPVTEILISAFLMIPKARLIGLYASFTLMLLFTGYIVAILNFAKRVPCSCGGILEKMGWTEHLIFNIAFTLLAMVGVLLKTNRPVLKKTMITQ